MSKNYTTVKTTDPVQNVKFEKSKKNTIKNPEKKLKSPRMKKPQKPVPNW